MIGSRLGHYEVLAMLGRGGMGEVYRARDTKLGREVAVKLLPPELASDAERMARFRREAKILASLNHPNIAGIHGLEEVAGQSFLVMELADGHDLAVRIARGALPVDEALMIARQIAEGLEDAHERGIVHRDLKPANVMVSGEGKVKILDFGLARAYVGDETGEGDPALSPTVTAAMTQAGVILGSAAYMSPEQAKGRALDRRTDIWAFGVILFEMLTGRRLFAEETISETMASVLKEPIAWERLPKDLPPSVRALLERCLQRDPRMRLRDIGEARIHLLDPHVSAVLHATISGPAVASPAPRSRSVGTWLPWLLFGVACAALVLFGPWRPRPQSANADGAAVLVRSSLESATGFGFHLTGASPAAMAIAPDGRTVVYGARDDKGLHALWLQVLDESAPTLIPGTEGGQYPFWSPDSRSIGYFTQGALRVVDLEGRTNREVVRASDGKGGCWLEDGTILFTPTATEAIHRVPSTGGQSEPLTRLDQEPRANSHRLPRPLPGTQNFLFAARTGSSGLEASVVVMLGHLDGSTPEVLLRADGQADFANGHLLYVLGSDLFARPFDPGHGTFSGPPILVADGVGTLPGAALGLFSASYDGRLVYHPGDYETMVTSLVWFDREGTEIGRMGEPTGFGSFDVSPDGQSVAFTSYDNRTGLGDLWMHDLENDIRTRLSFDPGDESYPQWSADGGTLYYVHLDPSESAILAMDPEGREPPRTILRHPHLVALTDLSPDGRTLAFTALDTTLNVTRSYLAPLDGSAPPQTVDDTVGETYSIRFSPDGRWVAYASRETGGLRLYLKTHPPSSRKWQLTDRNSFWYVWDPRGDRVYSQDSGGELYVTEVVLSGSTPRTGSTRVLLTGIPSPVTGVHDLGISPDGERFLVTSASGTDVSRPARLLVGWTALLDARRGDG